MDEFDTGGETATDDARQNGQAALGRAKGVASDAQQVASDAANAGRAYATDAINAAGKRIAEAKRQLGETTDYLAKAINDEPVKAVLIAAAVRAC